MGFKDAIELIAGGAGAISSIGSSNSLADAQKAAADKAKADASALVATEAQRRADAITLGKTYGQLAALQASNSGSASTMFASKIGKAGGG